MIEIMDQLSPVILESFVNVAVSDAVSCWWFQTKPGIQIKMCVKFISVLIFLGFLVEIIHTIHIHLFVVLDHLLGVLLEYIYRLVIQSVGASV